MSLLLICSSSFLINDLKIYQTLKRRPYIQFGNSHQLKKKDVTNSLPPPITMDLICPSSLIIKELKIDQTRI